MNDSEELPIVESQIRLALAILFLIFFWTIVGVFESIVVWHYARYGFPQLGASACLLVWIVGMATPAFMCHPKRYRLTTLTTGLLLSCFVFALSNIALRTAHPMGAKQLAAIESKLVIVFIVQLVLFATLWAFAFRKEVWQRTASEE